MNATRRLALGLILVSGTAVLAQTAPPAAAAAPAEPPRNKLPLFKDGPWKGYNAYYVRPFFDAVVDEDGRILIKPKDAKGKYVGTPVSFCGWSVSYRVPSETFHRPRPIIEFTDPPEPAQVSGGKVTLQGLCKDNVRFKFSWAFSGDVITSAGGIDDPAKIEYPSVLHIGTGIPASHNIPPQTEQEEREKLCAGYELSVKYTDGKRSHRTDHPYSKVLRFEGAVEEATIVGPWGPRRLTLNPRNTTMSGNIYSGNCPWQGYSFGYSTGITELVKHRAQFVLTVK